MQIAVIGLDKQQAGDDLAGRMPLLQMGQRGNPIVRIVIGRQLAQPQHRPIVLRDGLDRTGRKVGDDRLAFHHEVELVHRLVMGAYIIEALCRAGMIVERDTRRNHVDKRGTLVLNRCLDQRHELSLVAGETARDKRGAQLQRHRDKVDRRV